MSKSYSAPPRLLAHHPYPQKTSPLKPQPKPTRKSGPSPGIPGFQPRIPGFPPRIPGLYLRRCRENGGLVNPGLGFG
eukprot:671255-Amorphochlora_amoeboformis.AAC.1